MVTTLHWILLEQGVLINDAACRAQSHIRYCLLDWTCLGYFFCLDFGESEDKCVKPVGYVYVGTFVHYVRSQVYAKPISANNAGTNILYTSQIHNNTIL